jgi:oligoribonuclease NrnB/cAMP/cGMP phosphodiesterase (DHH superfamily)
VSIFQDMWDDFDEYLERQRQKKELERSIKDSLEEDTKQYKEYLKRYNHAKSLSEEHTQLKDALKDCTDGEASKALMLRLDESILKLRAVNHSFFLLRESIRVKSGGWW